MNSEAELYYVIDSSSATNDEKSAMKECLNLVVQQHKEKVKTIQRNVMTAVGLTINLNDQDDTDDINDGNDNDSTIITLPTPSSASSFRRRRSNDKKYKNQILKPALILSVDRISELLIGLISQPASSSLSSSINSMSSSSSLFLVRDIKLFEFSYKLPKGNSTYVRIREDLSDGFHTLEPGRHMVIACLRVVHEIASLHGYIFTHNSGVTKRKEQNQQQQNENENKKLSQESLAASSSSSVDVYDVISSKFTQNFPLARNLRGHNKCLREFQKCIVHCHKNSVESFVKANPNWRYRSNVTINYRIRKGLLPDEAGLTCHECSNSSSSNNNDNDKTDSVTTDEQQQKVVGDDDEDDDEVEAIVVQEKVLNHVQLRLRSSSSTVPKKTNSPTTPTPTTPPTTPPRSRSWSRTTNPSNSNSNSRMARMLQAYNAPPKKDKSKAVVAAAAADDDDDTTAAVADVVVVDATNSTTATSVVVAVADNNNENNTDNNDDDDMKVDNEENENNTEERVATAAAVVVAATSTDRRSTRSSVTAVTDTTTTTAAAAAAAVAITSTSNRNKKQPITATIAAVVQTTKGRKMAASIPLFQKVAPPKKSSIVPGSTSRRRSTRSVTANDTVVVVPPAAAGMSPRPKQATTKSKKKEEDPFDGNDDDNNNNSTRNDKDDYYNEYFAEEQKHQGKNEEEEESLLSSSQSSSSRSSSRSPSFSSPKVVTDKRMQMMQRLRKGKTKKKKLSSSSKEKKKQNISNNYQWEWEQPQPLLQQQEREKNLKVQKKGETNANPMEEERVKDMEDAAPAAVEKVVLPKTALSAKQGRLSQRHKEKNLKGKKKDQQEEKNTDLTEEKDFDDMEDAAPDEAALDSHKESSNKNNATTIIANATATVDDNEGVEEVDPVSAATEQKGVPPKHALSASYVKLYASPSRVIECSSISVPTIGPESDNDETDEERKLLVYVRYLVNSVFGADCINNELVQHELVDIPPYNSSLPRWFLCELMHWVKVVYDDLESFPMDKDLEYYRSPRFWEFLLQQFEAVKTQNSRYESERTAWILAIRTVLKKKTNKHKIIDLHKKSGKGGGMVDYDDITERIKGLIDRDEPCRSRSDQDTTPTLASASAAVHATVDAKKTKTTKKSPVATAATITAAVAVKKTAATTKKSVNAVTKAVVQTTKGQKMAAPPVKKAPAKKSIAEIDRGLDDKASVSAVLGLGSSISNVRRKSQTPQHQRPAKKRKLRK